VPNVFENARQQSGEVRVSAYKLEFEIVGLPKMTNTMRVHWSAKLRHAQLWKSKVAIKCQLAGKPPTPLAHAALTLTRCSAQEPDFDGLVSGFKSVIDGLVECGVLAGDKRSNIGQPQYHWQKVSPNKGKIIVSVEEITKEEK